MNELQRERARFSAERLRELADHVDGMSNDPDEAHQGRTIMNMRTWHQSYAPREGRGCGTAACVAGHAILLFGSSSEIAVLRDTGLAAGGAADLLGFVVHTIDMSPALFHLPDDCHFEPDGTAAAEVLRKAAEVIEDEDPALDGGLRRGIVSSEWFNAEIGQEAREAATREA